MSIATLKALPKNCHTAEFWLDYWELLVPIYDTYGLPIDIIYCKLRDDKEDYMLLDVWDMDSETFAKNFKQAVQFKQLGGWRKVMETIENKHEQIHTH